MKQNWKRIVLIAVIALVVIAGIAALTIWVILPAAKYGQAGKLEKGGDAAEAYEAYDHMADYRDALEAAQRLQDKVFASRPAEGSLTFAGYEWLVLEERDGKQLLLMKEVLDVRQYHNTLEQVDWEHCSLRAWLNGSFY